MTIDVFKTCNKHPNIWVVKIKRRSGSIRQLVTFSFFSSSIRIGSQNLSSSHSDEFVQVLEVERNFKHPRYDGVASYFDVGLLETKTVTFSPVK